MAALFGSHTQAVTPQRYNAIQLSSSALGGCIPLVYGRQRIPFNLIWYGAFTSSPVSQGGKGGPAQPSSYDYKASYACALCEGPIVGINQVWSDQDLTSLSLQGFALFTGAGGQATWSYLTTTFPSQAIPYDHICYVGAINHDLGSSAGMPNITFETDGFLGYNIGGGVYDADPSQFLVDYLTDPNHGVAGQLTTGMIASMSGNNNYQGYVQSLGLLLSYYESTQRAASDFLKEVLQITNSDCIWTGAGQIKILPYCDAPVSGNGFSFNPDLTPIFSFGDDDFLVDGDNQPPVTLTRKPISETYNDITVEYLDRSNSYNTAIAKATDLWDVSLNGLRPQTTLSFHSITSATVARTVAQLILQTSLYERNTYKFKVRADYSLLEPMDYIAITDAGLGLTNQVVRITSITDDENDVIEIEAMEIPGTVRNTPQYKWSANQGWNANYAVAPGSVQAPVFIEAPPALAPDSNGDLWIAVDGPSSSASWGGCQVYMSFDGTTYEPVGLITVPARYGTITSTMTAHADPDTANTVGVALNNTALDLGSGTMADADNNRLLIAIGSGSTLEIMSYETATLVSAGNYNLNYFRRNLFGTVNQVHSSGAQFVRLDGGLAVLPIDPGWRGTTLYFKFCSYNIYGRATEDISTVTAYSYTVAQPAVTATPMIARGNASISGEDYFKLISASAAWDSDCVATSPILAGNISAQYATGGALALGFVASTSSTVTPGAANTYVIYAHADSAQVVVQEGATVRYTGATPATGDLYDVRYDGFTLQYYINGVNVWNTPLQGAALYPAVTFYEGGCSFSNVQVLAGTLATPTQWKAAGTCTVNDANVYGGTGAWGGGAAYSIVGYGVCSIRGKVDATPVGTDFTNVMIGFSTAPTTSQSYTNANYAWHNSGGDGQWHIYESGFDQGAQGVIQATDVVWITYDGTNIRYYKNDPTTVIRTVAASGLTLYGFCPLYGPGAQINSLLFAPTINIALLDTGQLGTNAATDAGSSTVSNVALPYGSSGTYTTNLTTVTLGPYPQATTAVVTLAVTVGNIDATNSGAVWFDVQSTTESNLFYTGAGSTGGRPTVQLATSQVGTATAEVEITIPANTTETYTLQAQTSTSRITPQLVVDNAMLKVEAIKR